MGGKEHSDQEPLLKDYRDATDAPAEVPRPYTGPVPSRTEQLIFLMFSCFIVLMEHCCAIIVIANSEAMSKRAGLDVAWSGFMIAMIAPATILGIIPLTYFRRVSYRFGLVFHALCELFGGLGVVLSSNAVFFPGVCVGQFIISIGNGVVVILIYHSIKQLFIKKETTPIFLVNNAVAGMGVALGPTLSAALTTNFDGKTLQMNNNDGLPCLVPVCYGVVLILLVLLFFPKVLNDKLTSATAESPSGVADIPPPHRQDHQKSAREVVTVDVIDRPSVAPPSTPTFANQLAVACTLFVSLTRTFIRLAWETGAVSVLANLYRQGAHAGFFIGIIAACYPAFVVSLTVLSRYWNDHKMMLLLECCEILGALLLFRWVFLDNGRKDGLVWRSLFLFGSALLYYSNNGQSGILSSQLMKNSVVGDKWLDPNKLLSAYQVLAAVGMGFGPLLARGVLSYNYKQNSFALLLGLTTLLQTLVTGGYFCWASVSKTHVEV
eukprot:CAMPEP_0175147326 /NCGR_PEP_ID=MMETSP0087-20121206/15925_1 /TAXON_ID=136419 /ORGANISM="Unknown Unknown, Strain D1" /LENGTH=491 /DNA_ID=CAMNT_0016432493 /DNA_START=27 /DNA_END=1502 /DNA_ORIENTATION=+